MQAGLTRAESAEFDTLKAKLFQGASFVVMEEGADTERYNELMMRIQKARKAEANRPYYVIPVYDKSKSLYWNWNTGRISNFGSFQTGILQAYRIADKGNSERLELAFPDWFTTPEMEEYLDNEDQPKHFFSQPATK